MKNEKFKQLVKDSLGITVLIYGINAIVHKVNTGNTFITESLLTPEVLAKSASMGVGIFIAKAIISYLNQQQDRIEEEEKNISKMKP